MCIGFQSSLFFLYIFLQNYMCLILQFHFFQKSVYNLKTNLPLQKLIIPIHQEKYRCESINNIMAMFNEFKNNTQILRKTFQKMYSITEAEIKPQWMDENFLKENSPHIFLQLLHYVLVDFSPYVIFVKVLDYFPTIKDDNDKKFVSNVMTLGRKMFDVDVKIDVDQFLSQKFVEKKTQWMAQFCKSIYQMHLKESKNSLQNKSFVNTIQQKKANQATSLKQVTKKASNFVANDDDSDDEAPRNLNVMPSNSRKPVAEKPQRIFGKRQNHDSSSDQDMKELLSKKSQLNKIKQKSNKNEQKSFFQVEQKIEIKKNYVKPIGIKTGNLDKKNLHQQEQQDEAINEYLPKGNFHRSVKSNENLYPLKEQHHPNNSQQEQPKQYVTRQQLMQIMGGVSKNFSEILTKFSEFQSQVGGWVQNINAKISIIEENVKTIKNNL